MAETKTLDLSAPPERATVILPDGASHEIRAPEEFTTAEFRSLSRKLRELREAEDDETAFDMIDALVAEVFVVTPDLNQLTIGHKHRIVDFFSSLGAAAQPTPTTSQSPEPSDSSAAT